MILQQLINGVVVGSVYALFSLGFTLIFGLARVINLAHGSLFMWSALAAALVTQAGLPFYAAVVVAILVGGSLAMLLEFLVFRPLRRRRASEFSALVASLGAGLILISAAQQASNTQVLRFPFGIFPVMLYRLWGLRISVLQLTIVACVCLMVVFLVLLIYRTSYGRQLRAVSLNERTARLLGVNAPLVFLVTFFLSGALAGVAGLMIGVAFNSIHFLMGEPYLLRAFVIVVIGGLGSISGAVVASLLVGITQTIIIATPYSGLSDAILFGALFIVLLARPRGLFGDPNLAAAR